MRPRVLLVLLVLAGCGGASGGSDERRAPDAGARAAVLRWGNTKAQELRVRAVDVTGDRALAQVHADRFGLQADGTVRAVREGGGWRVVGAEPDLLRSFAAGYARRSNDDVLGHRAVASCLRKGTSRLSAGQTRAFIAIAEADPNSTRTAKRVEGFLTGCRERVHRFVSDYYVEVASSRILNKRVLRCVRGKLLDATAGQRRRLLRAALTGDPDKYAVNGVEATAFNCAYDAQR